MSKTLVIPLDSELADANWIDYLVICVDMEGAVLTRANLEQVTRSVDLDSFFRADDYDTDAFSKAMQKAFTDRGYTVVFADIAKLAWPGL